MGHTAAQLESILSWYVGCDAIQETLDNVNLELAPFGFMAHFEHDIIVVRPKARIVKSKPIVRLRRESPTKRQSIFP